jgi:hypothetical protein
LAGLLPEIDMDSKGVADGATVVGRTERPFDPDNRNTANFPNIQTP